MSVFRIDAAGRYGKAVPGSEKRLCLSVCTRDLYMKRQKKAIDGKKNTISMCSNLCVVLMGRVLILSLH